MDNKKWYKRISTCFWFMLATLPFWLSTFAYIFSFLIHFDGVTEYSDINNFYSTRTWSYFMDLNVSAFSSWTPSWLKNMFRDLFVNFSTQNVSGWLIPSLGWFCWVYIIEVMVDLFVWLPRWMHQMLEKGVGKID